MTILAYSISAGVIIDRFRNIRRRRIEAMPAPKTVVISMDGAVPTVKSGDHVALGALIGESEECAVHASISGTVTEVSSDFVKIENGLTDDVAPMFPIAKKLSEVTEEEILEVLRTAGISSDESLYTTVKAARGKIDKIIINCCEEPPLGAKERLVSEQPAAVVNGVKILLKALGVKVAYIAIENTKAEAIARLEEAIRGSRMVMLRTVLPKYPLSDDRQIAYLLNDYPISATGPIHESGCAVFGAEACAAIFKAFATGSPYTNRIITVGGDCLKKQTTVAVPLGASLSDIVEFCGGLIRQPRYLIDGGIMSDEAVEDVQFYVTKKTKAILLLSEKAVASRDAESPCIRCGRCITHCPMHLMPVYIAEYASRENYKKAAEYNAEICSECGVCSYVCPAERDIVSLVRKAKLGIASLECEIQPEDGVKDGE